MKKNKLALRIVAFVVALCLVAGILMVANAFLGNPITAYYANKAIKNYVAEKYAHLDLEVSKAQYIFLSGEYKAVAQSSTSTDTHFAIYYRDGLIRRDDYDSHVVSQFNTLMRLQDEYAKHVTSILARVAELQNNKTRVQIENWQELKDQGFIKLDMMLDRSLPIEAKAIITINRDDRSISSIAEMLANAHKELMAERCVFVSYDCVLQSGNESVTLENLSPDDMESGHLEKLIEDALFN